MRPPPLVALTPGELDERTARTWLASLESLFAAGWRGVVLREFRLGDRSYLDLARAVRNVWPRDAGGWLCVHDRAHLASESDADAVQLSGASLTPALVRPWLDARCSIGLSTHAEDATERWAGADWIVHGPVQRTSKPHAREPVGWSGLSAAVERSPAPVWALGGLAPEHVAQARACGAAGVAVWSGVFGSADPLAAAAKYLQAWRSAPGA